MKDLKKVLIVTLIIAIAVFSMGLSFASEEDIPEQTEENTIVIDNYDDYQKLLANDFDYYADGQDGQTQYEPSEDELKDYYLDYHEYMLDYYDSYTRPENIRALVTEVGRTKESYEATDYYSVSKYVLQDVKAKILEGEHAGEEIEMEYLLSADSLNNIELAPLHVGDKIFVNITEGEDGSISGEISNSWSTVQRINYVICFGIIVAILLLIYAGKKGINAILITLIVIIVCTIIVPVFVYEGKSTMWISAFASIAVISAVCLAHLGLTKNTIKAVCVSTIMSIFALLLAIGMSHVTRTVGTVFEYAAIAENVLLGNINFTNLFYASVMLIGAGMIANAVSTSIIKIERESADNFNEKVGLCKNIMLTHVVVTALLLLVPYIPNHVLLFTNKFRQEEIINSETLVSEFIRIFAVQSAIILSIPVISLDNFKVGKKYLKEAEKEEK